MESEEREGQSEVLYLCWLQHVCVGMSVCVHDAEAGGAGGSGPTTVFMLLLLQI